MQPFRFKFIKINPTSLKEKIVKSNLQILRFSFKVKISWTLFQATSVAILTFSSHVCSLILLRPEGRAGEALEP
jgi:hypothetical protein